MENSKSLAHRLVPYIGPALGMIESWGNSGHRGYVGADGLLRPHVVGGVDGVDMGVLCRGCVWNWDFIERVVERRVKRTASCEHLEKLLQEMWNLKFLCCD